MAIATPQEAAAVFKSRVFLVKIAIGQPAGNITFEAEQTRKQGLVEVLKESGGRLGKDALPVFQVVDEAGKVVVSAKKAHTRAATVLDNLQDKYMLSAGKSGSWYVPESKIPDLEADLENQLQAEINVLAEELDSVYDEAEADFDERLTNTLKAAGIYEDYFAYYRAQFPSRGELKTNFSIRVEQWEPMKSLEEVIELAEVDSARRREVDVVRAQLKALRESAPKIEDDLFKQIAKAMSVLEDNDWTALEGEKLASRWEKICETVRRVQTLSELWSKIDPDRNWVDETFAPIGELGALAISRKSVESQCWELRSKWREELAISPVGEGSKMFYTWLYPEVRLDQQLADVQEKLAADPTNEKLLKRLDDLKLALAVKVSKLQELLGAEFASPIAIPDELPTLPAAEPESTEPAEVEQVTSEAEPAAKPASKRQRSATKGKTSRKKSDAPEVDPEVAEAGF